jgi:adenylate cyclase
MGVIDHEQHRGTAIGERGAQPEDAVRNARRRVRARDAAAEQEIPGLSGRPVEQPRLLALASLMHGRFQQRTDHAIGKVTLLRAGCGASDPVASFRCGGDRPLHERGLSKPGRRLNSHNPTNPVCQPGDGCSERVQFAVAFDQISFGGLGVIELRSDAGLERRARRGPLHGASIDLAIGRGQLTLDRGFEAKVQGRVPIVELRLTSQNERHVDGQTRDKPMTGVMASRRVSAFWIDGLLATRRRRWMRSHPAPTFVFVDLAGYTALTEMRGDQVAASVANEFQRTMSDLSRRHGAWQVKTMGDGVMIWAPDAARAVALAAATLKEFGSRLDLLPVRIGVNTGPAVMWGWDWYGSTVNVAARLASQAGPNEAFVSATSRAAVSGDLPRSLERRRLLRLRGVERPVVVWCLR